MVSGHLGVNKPGVSWILSTLASGMWKHDGWVGGAACSVGWASALLAAGRNHNGWVCGGAHTWSPRPISLAAEVHCSIRTPQMRRAWCPWLRQRLCMMSRGVACSTLQQRHLPESGFAFIGAGVRTLVHCWFRNGVPRVVELALPPFRGEGNRSIQLVHREFAAASAIVEQSMARYGRRGPVAPMTQEVVPPEESGLDEDELQANGSFEKLEIGLDAQESSLSTTCKVQERLQFFRELGLSEANLTRLQSCTKSSIRFAILRHSLKNSSHVAAFLTEEVGCSGPQAALCMFDNVYLASSSVDACLRPKVQYLQGLGFSKEQMVKCICRHPRVLTCHMERHVLAMTRALIELGLKNEDIVKAYLKHPMLITSSMNKFDEVVGFMQSLGVVDLPRYLKAHPQLFGYSVNDNLRVKTDYFLCMGLTKDDVARMIKLYPSVLSYSLERTIKPKVEYLKAVMKKDVVELVAHPAYIGYSLSGRIQPRYEYAVAAGCGFTSLSYNLSCSDEVFMRRCKRKVLKLKADEEQGKQPKRSRK